MKVFSVLFVPFSYPGYNIPQANGFVNSFSKNFLAVLFKINNKIFSLDIAFQSCYY